MINTPSTAPPKARSFPSGRLETVLSLASLCLLLGLLTNGCVSGPRGFPAREGINNLDRVHDNLYRGAQPNNLGLQALARLGIKTIINLRQPNDVWPAEAFEAHALGLTYTNVPMAGCAQPEMPQIETVLALLDSLPQPVFVHCKYGCDRTGAIVACYRIRHDHWPWRDALREAMQYGMAKGCDGMRQAIEIFANGGLDDPENHVR